MTPLRALDGVRDEATRRRVLQYIEGQGGRVTSSSGDVLAVELPSWLAVVNVMALMALDAAEYQPSFVRLALDLGTPERALEYVQREIEWRDEPGERLSYPTTTLARGWGDCDCSAVVVVGLWSALGYPSAPCALTLDGVPTHAAGALQRGARNWSWGDPSEPGPLRPWSRHPLAADTRPGRRGILAPSVVSVPRWP